MPLVPLCTLDPDDPGGGFSREGNELPPEISRERRGSSQAVGSTAPSHLRCWLCGRRGVQRTWRVAASMSVTPSSETVRKRRAQVQPTSSTGSYDSQDTATTPRKLLLAHNDAVQMEGIAPDTSVALMLLVGVRVLSALVNTVHDCDEVFNYWEPLHYLLYGYGMQTWEYGSQFALRSYLYIVLHAVVAAPVGLVFGAEHGKIAVFYTTRILLGIVCALAEVALYKGLMSACGPRPARYLLFLLLVSSGMFTASTTLLPSTLSMYFTTLASSAVLDYNPVLVTLYVIVGALLGWPVAALAAVPLGFFVLVVGKLSNVVSMGVLVLFSLLSLSAIVDQLFYGRWTLSLFNFLIYNAVGADGDGGNSQLYGVEGPFFYLKNALNNFNVVLMLAMSFPVVALLSRQRRRKLMLLAASPLYVWFTFMSALPHKEERFLYIVYPHLCLAAAGTIASTANFLEAMFHLFFKNRSLARCFGKAARRAILCCTCVLSLARTMALLLHYRAPMVIYTNLPKLESVQGPAAPATSLVCVGAEWYRFPSSFFLPSPMYRLGFVDAGFKGLLPRNFDPKAGGTAAAPEQFNGRNIAAKDQFVEKIDMCDFYVGWDGDGATADGTREWRTLARHSFVDAAQSPRLYRALYIPWLSSKKVKYVDYILLERLPAERSAATPDAECTAQPPSEE